MKKLIKLLIFVTIAAILLPGKFIYAKEEFPDEKGFRGIWVATVLNIDYPSQPTTDSEMLKNEAIKILDNAKTLEMQGVFLQIRPSGDALYKSDYYPWSKYLTGKQGEAPTCDFDPLKFWIEEAHKRGIELHAWINPYRVTKKTVNELAHDFDSLSPSNPAVKNPSWVVKHSDGNLYLNPGIPQVRMYIIDSVIEILDNYDVDGIHMDDYFYPGKTFDDNNEYTRYGNGGFPNIYEWRRECVNLLVKGLGKKIKSHSPNVRFGISPFGIWANKNSNPLGSDTRGAQSYYDHYADTRKWVKEEIIDYIAPQIYWHIGYDIADYKKLAYWWSDVVKDTTVDLYIGQALYRVQHSNPKNPWYGTDEIIKQLNLNTQIPEIKGSIFYNYSSAEKDPMIFDSIR